VLEIYEARIALESAATSAAANRGTRLDLMKLEHLSSRAKEATDQIERRRAHSEWHECLWQAGHNFVIQSTLTKLMAQLRIYDHTLPDPIDDLDVSDGEHAQIMAAIQTNDATAAGELMAEHLRRSRDLRLQTLVRADV
jgi:DNA-binding GntR family transcriptional regulator